MHRSRSAVERQPALQRGNRPTALLSALLLGSILAAASPGQDPAQEIERLRTALDQPGADGREAREAAVVRLLALPHASAHRVLQQALLRKEDPDQLGAAILQALQAQLLAPAASQFGGAAAEIRREVLMGYLAALAQFWPAQAADNELPLGALGPMARRVLQRVPLRELEDALRALLPAADLPTRLALLRAVADVQQVGLGVLLADFLDSGEAEAAQMARRSLRLLTFHEEEFTSKAMFSSWFERNGQVRYVDLAERAARDAERRMQRAREEQQRIRLDAAREFVRAHTSRRPGTDWGQIQARTLVDDPAVMDACLELLQQALATGLPGDDNPLPRQAFARALLQRWRLVAPEQQRRRSLLLEVAAGLTRVEEAELAAELAALLLAQLEQGGSEQQVAALRGLRRFPTVETRTRVVRFLLQRIDQDPAPLPLFETALQTLAWRQAPRWVAPAENDPDRAEWLQLLRSLCTVPRLQSQRDAALNLALTLDAREQRLGAVFGLLLALASDPQLDGRFRASCLIHLQGWRDQSGQVEEWVAGMQQLLEDREPQVRQMAAESLTRLVDVPDPRRSGWVAQTITLLREHLQREPSPAVLQAMAETLQVCGREPQMTERAIQAINLVLGDLGFPPPAEHLFRVEPLLSALATIAADARAERGQWLGACHLLLQYEKRQSLRLILLNHAAVELAAAVQSAEAGLADRAREAMHWLIRTALLKSAREPWSSSEELLREAREVRTAFAALDQLAEPQQLLEPAHRLLRLEVELACGRYAEVVQMATAMLKAPANGVRSNGSTSQRELLQSLLAEALLGLGKPDQAARVFADGDVVQDPRTAELLARTARALLATDAERAVALFARALAATVAEDPQFRLRLLEWGEAQLGLDPAARAAVQARLQPHAALFDSQDCPPEQRSAYNRLVAER